MAFKPESLRRWAHQGPSSRPPSSSPGPSPRRPAAADLPPPPPGFGYVQDQAHGWVLVPISSAARPSAPARRAPEASGPGGAVIPIRRGSTQLVRGLIGGQDPYDEFLAKLPEIGPGDYGSHVAAGLVPNEEEIANLPEMARPMAVDPQTQAHENPADDAFGGASLKSSGIKSLGDGGGGK